MEEQNYSADSPVIQKEDDRFSRWTFSERVAEVISKRSDPSSIVIGLYGVWGDGKTSVLNFIENSLSTDENVICIKFNPWRFGTEDELLSGFFFDIADALDAKLIKTGDKLKDFIKKAAPGAGAILGAKGTGDAVGSFLSTPDVNELKSRIEGALETAKRRVLILIDDVDRLENSEIHALFKLVKLTADFKYTSYILAFDKDVVAASLQERYSSTKNNAGEDFLEKIIQVPLHLPSVEQPILREFCFKGVDEALSISGIKLSQQQVQEFVRDFSDAFDDCLTTPRKAKLYGNTLLFSLPILKGEVNPVDLMLIEGIRIFFPSLYVIIRKNKSLFTGSFSERNHSDSEPEKEHIKSLIDTALLNTEEVDKKGVIRLIKNMFPKLNSVYGNTTYGSDWFKEWDKGQRICAETYFSRYFTYSIPRNDIADGLITTLISECPKWIAEHEKEENPLSNILTASNAELLIKKLRRISDEIAPQESMALAIAISNKSDSYPNPDTLFSHMNPLVQAAMLVSSLIQNSETSTRKTIVEACIKITPCLEFKLEVFQWLKREEEDKPEKDAFSKSEIDDIGIFLANELLKHIDQGIDITSNYPNSVGIILYTLNKYIGRECSNAYMKNQFESDPDSLIRFLGALVPTSWGMESGVSNKSDFEREQYNSLINLLDINIVLDAIKVLVDEVPVIPEDYPKDYENKDEYIFIKQLLWLHRFVQKENEINRGVTET